MSTHILLLEDTYSEQRRIVEHLHGDGYIVDAHARIDSAKEFFNSNSKLIDCIVVDLNMDEKWLGDFSTEADGGWRSGWIFLQRYVYPIEPCMPTVVYSAAIDETLIVTIRNNAPNACIEFVPKGNYADGGIKALLMAIERVTGRRGE